VMKDNGWKREYHRVINLTVGSSVESNPVLSEDEKLGEYDELLPPGGTFPPEDEGTAPDTGDATTSDEKPSGTAPEIVIACVAIPVILIAVVIVIVVSKKKK